MGKASSSKKVARAAGTGGGRTARGRTPWTYYGIILAVVVLGLVGTLASRDHRLAQLNAAGSTSPPAVGSTESAAFALDVCGTLQPNLKTSKDPVGLATQGDGIIHIHPFAASAAGANATLGLFASSIGMKLNANELQAPGGKAHHDGDKCNGQPGHVYVRHFAYPGAPLTSGTLETSDPQAVHLDDGSEYTIAFVPAAQKNQIPPPASAVVTTLTNLEAAATAATSSTTTGAAPTPSVSTPGTSTPGTSTPATSTPATSTAPTPASSPPTTAKP